MNADLPVPPKRPPVDGGMARSDPFLQFQADLLGLPVQRSPYPESTALGAALLAGLGVGLWPGPSEPSPCSRKEVASLLQNKTKPGDPQPSVDGATLSRPSGPTTGRMRNQPETDRAGELPGRLAFRARPILKDSTDDDMALRGAGPALRRRPGGTGGVEQRAPGANGHPVPAAFTSFATGTMALFAFALALRPSWPKASNLATGPWWIWLGGVVGACYIMAAVTYANKLGAAGWLGVVVTGQILTSVLLDHFGLVGFTVHPIKPWRVVGVVLLLAGVALVLRS